MTLPLKLEKKVVTLNYRQASISGTSYYLLIDLDNACGKYKHAVGNGIKLVGLHGTFLKTKMAEEWVTYVGTVLSVDGTKSRIGWHRFGTLGLRDNDHFQEEVTLQLGTMVLATDVEEGDFSRMANNFQTDETSLANGGAIPDVSGTNRAVEPGDLILKVEKIGSGSGAAMFHHLIWYYVE